MKYFFIIYVSTAFLLMSCDTKTHTSKEKQSISITSSDVFPNEIQRFKFNSEKSQKIIGKYGTTLFFPKGVFGKNITVNIELIECYSIQSMLINKLSSLTLDNRVLESGGMIYINAVDNNGNNLKINQEIKIQMPVFSQKKYKVFEGIVNNYVSWKELKDTIIDGISGAETYQPITYSNPEELSKINDTLDNKKESNIVINNKIKNDKLVNYVFQISKLGWINLDNYLENKSKDLTVISDKSNDGAMFYLVLKNYNSILVGIPKVSSGKIQFKNIPCSEPFTIVGYGMKGDELYFKMIDYRNNDANIDFPALEKTTRTEIVNKLYNKFGNSIWERPNT